MFENHQGAYVECVYPNRNQLMALGKHPWSGDEHGYQYRVVFASLAKICQVKIDLQIKHWISNKTSAKSYK